MLTKIISGGLTGANQAALDAAIELGIPHGGLIPKGRLTEAGSLSEKYALTEMPSKDYLKRTKQNVLDSDGTVIFSHGDLKGGSKRTADYATELHKPFLHVDLKKTFPTESAEVLVAWIKAHGIKGQQGLVGLRQGASRDRTCCRTQTGAGETRMARACHLEGL